MTTENPATPPKKHIRLPKSLRSRILISLVGFFAALALVGTLVVGFAMTVAYPNLPPLDQLTDYKPKMPLRVFTADNVLIGEFGEERRNLVRIKDVPDHMKKAVLAIEDDRFYEHGGVDYLGIMRAALHNLLGGSKQGASTITQQVARNFFLTSEQTLKRKIYEVLLAWKIEQKLTKDQILEIYMNQIYLGQRAFGFSSAAQIYFGKPLKDITIAEAAMLAGLPKAPSANNPVANPARAKVRQQYILQRMRNLGYITNAEYEKAKNEVIKIKSDSSEFGIHAEYVAEMARMLVYEQYKEDTYTRGLNVYTTITKADQEAAYAAVRRGVMDYEKRHGYRGPEGYMDIPAGKEAAADAIETELSEYADSDDIMAAVVLEASPKLVKVVLDSGEEVSITGSGLTLATAALSGNAPQNRRIKRGSIIRVMQEGKNWVITQMPQVESAFVSMSTTDGAIRALVGGFDFNRNKFNHVTQAWRQPGSSFKPFIYSAALERGFSPATVINDAPLFFSATQTGGQAWEPKNYDGKFEGPMSMRRGLAKSKNMISIRVLNKIGPQFAQEHATRFGFDAEKHPPYLTLALGAGSVTPLQMATAYAVFANGGYKVNPHIISRITSSEGKLLSQARPVKAGDETIRVLDARNAFVMDSMMRDVTRYGTAAKAASLNRPDIAGKTGTTNDSIDAWFAGYQPKLVGIAWMGYDQPRNLGSRETGGGLSLPIWISYMQTALKDLPVEQRPVPERLQNINGEYYFEEYPPGAGVRSLGMEQAWPYPQNEADSIKEEDSEEQ